MGDEAALLIGYGQEVFPAVSIRQVRDDEHPEDVEAAVRVPAALWAEYRAAVQRLEVAEAAIVALDPGRPEYRDLSLGLRWPDPGDVAAAAGPVIDVDDVLEDVEAYGGLCSSAQYEGERGIDPRPTRDDAAALLATIRAKLTGARS